MSFFFYFRVCRVLLARERDEERNRNLSIVFVISCFFWIVLWIPHYFYFLIGSPKQYFTNRTFGYLAYKYLMIYKSTIQMVYSQINAFLILIVLKPFQEQIKAIFLSVLMTHNAEKVANARTDAPGKKQNNDLATNDQTQSNLRGFFVLLVVIISLLASLLTGCQVCIQKQMKKDVLQMKRETVNLKTITTHKSVSASHQKDLIAEMSMPLVACSFNHGFVNFKYQRCYFLAHHLGSGLQIHEQVGYCQSKNASLFYPRIRAEADFMWNFYTASRNWNIKLLPPENETWYLHTGFNVTKKNDTLRSFDGRFERVDRSLWGRMTFYGGHWSFTGPRLCKWGDQEHWPHTSCHPGLRCDYSICFMDFSRDPHLNH